MKTRIVNLKWRKVDKNNRLGLLNRFS